MVIAIFHSCLVHAAFVSILFAKLLIE